MKMRAWLVGIVLAAASVTVGCSSGSDPDRKAAVTPKDVVKKLAASEARVLDLGKDVEVVAELPRKVGEEDVLYRGFTDDGLVVGWMSRPAPPSDFIPGPPSPYQSHAFIYDLESGDFTILDDTPQPEPTSIADVVGTDDVVVWIETPDSMEPHNFTVRSYDRATSKVTDLASFTNPGGQVWYDNDLTVRGGNAYFSRHVFSKKSKAEPAVYTVPVDGSKPVGVLIPDAEEISIDGDVLTYWDGKKSMQRDLSSGATSPASTSPSAGDPGFCGATFTETFETDCVGRPAHAPETNEADIVDPVLTITPATGAAVVVKDLPGDDDGFPPPMPADIQAFGDWIGFTMSSGDTPSPQYFVDPTTEVLWIMSKDSMLEAPSPDGTLALLNEFIANSLVTKVVRTPQT